MKYLKTYNESVLNKVHRFDYIESIISDIKDITLELIDDGYRISITNNSDFPNSLTNIYVSISKGRDKNNTDVSYFTKFNISVVREYHERIVLLIGDNLNSVELKWQGKNRMGKSVDFPEEDEVVDVIMMTYRVS